MARVYALLACAVGLACALSEAPRPSQSVLWRAPQLPEEPARLRLEPFVSVSRIGETALIRVRGSTAPEARCTWNDEGAANGDAPLHVASPTYAGVVDVRCEAGEARASAQVTFTDAQTLPQSDPYAAGVVLFKLRQAPSQPLSPVGSRELGSSSLNAKLRQFGAWALPAFPLGLGGYPDTVGLRHWIVVSLPPGVNYYQAVSALRSDPSVLPQSYLPEDGGFLAVTATPSWPLPLVRATREEQPEFARVVPGPPVFGERAKAPGLVAIEAGSAWKLSDGTGVDIAIVDTGVDLNHASLASKLVHKAEERSRTDADGNGIPGDESGANFAHLSIARRAGPPRLGLGLVSDLSDWDGALEPERERRWGHGTALASLAAGSGAQGTPLGVAPGAGLLVVDVQENLRASASRLHHPDPRMRERDPRGSALHSSTWSRALGVAYAVVEGARVLTCAWSEDTPHWILYDALRFAEDACALPVCAVEQAPGPLDTYPGQWRRSWLEANQLRGASVIDLWTGEVMEEFHARPLDATLIVSALGRGGRPVAYAEEVLPDLFTPLGGPGAGLEAALSNPRNDHGPGPDVRRFELEGDATAVGLTAGASALVFSLRPDLDPESVRNVLLGAATAGEAGPVLQAAAALETARSQPRGSCRTPLGNAR